MGEYTGDLADLQHHWGSAYLISHPGPDLWLAQRRDTREVLRSDSAASLLDLIRADYAERPVSRQIAGPTARRRPAAGSGPRAERTRG